MVNAFKIEHGIKCWFWGLITQKLKQLQQKRSAGQGLLSMLILEKSDNSFSFVL